MAKLTGIGFGFGIKKSTGIGFGFGIVEGGFTPGLVDEDGSRDPRSVETGSHAKQRNSTHITLFPGRQVAVFVGLDKSKKETQRRDET